MNTSTPTDTHHRCRPEIVSHAVWRSCRLRLSGREVEARLCTRGMMVTDEAIRQWCGTFGPSHANQRRRRRPGPGDHWPLGDVMLTLHGGRHDLWRAVDQDDHVLEILVQRRRHKRAVKTCFKKLLKGLPCVPRVLITDQLKSDAAATGEVLPGVGHRQHRALKNRCEHTHRPMRERERRMQWFKSLGQAQRLWSAS
jgi:putative transposase